MSGPEPTASGKSSLRIFLLLAALGVAALVLGRRQSGPETGVVATDFSLPVVNASGGEFRLSAERGKPVVMEVFASWCGVCRRNAPAVSAAAAARRKREVRFIGVSVDDDVEDARRTAREWGLSYAVLHDNGVVGRAYRIKSLPTFVLIDADGRVLDARVGALDERAIERWMARVGAERL